MKIRVYLVLSLLLYQLSPVSVRHAFYDTVSVKKFYDMTLGQLMKMEVTVASKKAQTTRESPGIVTLITDLRIELASRKTN